MNDEQKKAIIAPYKRVINDFLTMPLEGNMGYKYHTRAMMEIIFLYKNGVDAKNPDLLGKDNKNTFVDEAQSEIEKIKEQVRLDIVDMGFQIPGAVDLGRFVPKAANRKMLEENDFSITLDQVPDDAIDYGSGFLKTFRVEGLMKLNSIDPFNMIYNQRNFKGGPKVERMKETVKWIVDNDKYDAIPRLALKTKYENEEKGMETEILFYQVVEDLKAGGQVLSIINIEDDEIYYRFESKTKIVSYYKFDCEVRRGFKDACGRGKYERVFNKIIRGKVNRERFDTIMEIASKLPFQKQIDNERDNYVGKQVTNLKTGAIIGHKGNPIEPIDTGGVKQANLITMELGEIVSSIGTDLNVGDALQGKTLPSGTSGELGNLLTENQSSVHKEIQKNYAKFLNIVYKDKGGLTEYILEVFDSEDNLRDYLDPNDIKLVEKNVIAFKVAQKQVDAGILEEPFNLALATEEVKREIKGQPLISGQLLADLRENVKGIRTFITGEKVSKAKSVAYIRGMRDKYESNPAIFKDPAYIAMLKAEAEFDVGLDPIEIDNLLAEIA
tara:strand:+ start:631 stop:2292 length:1662 start_codon:yes stop_codon:yes gene_type:complete